MSDLTTKKCVSCEGGVPALTMARAKLFLQQTPGWELKGDKEGNKISKTFTFKNFKMAIAFVNKVADLAESEGHHPDMLIFSWNKVTITLWTHAIGGLSENDFIMAAKINMLISMAKI